MKAFLSLFIALVIGIFSTIPVLAHSGRTDSEGGHYDHSTGEYHYHHGYPAHQHENGECPYRFDDKAGQDSGGSDGSLKGDYSGGSGSDSDDPTAYYVLFGIAGVGLLIWFIRKVREEKKAIHTPPKPDPSPAPDPPTPPSPRMKPIRLVSPDPEPTEPLDPKTQMVTLPIVRKPRPDPDSVLTVEDIMPPLKKTPPVTTKLEHSKPQPSSTLTLKAQPMPSAAVYQSREVQPTPPQKATSTSSTAYDPNHYTFAIREVKSSSIHSIGYSNGTLTVRFRSGREYIYFDVSISEYFSFINAPSVGKYYNEHIRQKYHGDFVGIKDSEAPKPLTPPNP